MDTTMHGFRLVSSSELKEIKGTADIYKHDKSGLTMVHLNCADTNKAFAMSFCTPPENSTGVPHILEHSVLAGSDKCLYGCGAQSPYPFRARNILAGRLAL